MLLQSAKRLLIITFSIIIIQKESFAQINKQKAITYNLSFAAITSGIGAVINKEKKDKFIPTLIKGIGKGLIGGTAVYGSKQMIRQFVKTERYTYVWGGNILNALGNSIIENGAANRKIFSQFYYTFGFNRFDIYTPNKIKLRYRVMPVALFGFSTTLIKGYAFDYKKTIKSGFLVFETNEMNSPFLDDVGGQATVNTLTLKRTLSASEKMGVLGHEIIHGYQHLDYFRVNPFLIRAQRDWVNHENKVVAFYEKWVYSDWTYALQGYFYLNQMERSKEYYDNFYEAEADFFSEKEHQ